MSEVGGRRQEEARRAVASRVEELARSAEAATLKRARDGLRALLATPKARAPGLAKVEDLSVTGAGGPLRGRYYEPADAAPGPLVLFLHGGGFVVGDIDTHDSICSWLTKSSRARLLSVGYRLAPETRYPGQLEDARAACAWALAHAEQFGAAPERIALAGDSAGAYLAALCALELNRARPGTVALQTLLYPLVHIEDSLWAEEEVRNFRFLGRVACLYIARSLAADAFPSLLDMDLAHAPPTIIAGGGPLDPVRADVKSLAGALKAAGVRVSERKYPALMHGGLNFTALSKLAVEALSEVGALMREELDR